ncbi:MAG: pyruvate carboxylase [Bacteroidia bacterium]|nr:pyruvate carboxylase [Bacteroidia bacterium]MCF8425626.1 pyruvate carboxylase [Bacteroidia bacterium]MCF8445671.1 pyruvate carboxylase [Bacteroidia bacterium]
MKIQKILVANRGEIAIRVFRAAVELEIKTVAIYTYEDRHSLHRYKADESYQIGKDSDPLKPYLDIEEIIHVAKSHQVDAIHPGYGFLSENALFAQRCGEEGIIFIGPSPEVMRQLGDKVMAKKVAIQAQVPIIEDSHHELINYEIAASEAKRVGFPIMLKAAAGGGGRGMRVVRSSEDLEKNFNEAKNEAKVAFGDDTIFIEKFIDQPRHIEVQIMGDNHGNLIHLHERDCSVQRRFQKVVEMAPAPSISQETREQLHAYAIKICKTVNFNNVGTVEFLVDQQENIYFIEVNPRIQVEHTVTEAITGVDIVKSQIRIAEGFTLSSPEINIGDQSHVVADRFAIQVRITTEDPANGFKPDHGTIIAYRNAGGPGIRLDEGSAYPNVKISPFFDSLLVKITASGRNLFEVSERLQRVLKEFRIRGVKTNISFLENVLKHPTFLEGKTTVNFIDSHPELFKFTKKMDRGTKALMYIADITVNGNPDVKFVDQKKNFRNPVVPDFNKYDAFPKGTKDKLNELGRDKFTAWLKQEKSIQYTDCTWRDAHQSLLATRVRTLDILKVAESYAKNNPQVFSLEMWGGATFDVALRFLHENPWYRLQVLREAAPNILFQMLIRGANAVGYKAYPDNLVEKFIEESSNNGIDIFRIFDSLNWIEGMRNSIKAVNERTPGLAEACICYTGDFLDPKKNQKFNLEYYLSLARQLEDAGAHILGIKDMAGLLKPYQASVLITELKKTVSIPIHLHTHDTSSIQPATYLKAIEAGVDVIDVALASMSGLTSQPNFNSIVAMMEGQDREQKMNLNSLNDFSNYWEAVREFYYPFEHELKGGTAEVYDHEIPGGQYSNLRPQARSLGLEDKFETIKENYVVANQLFGDIVKVTPSSKVVGDMALFMTSNGYSAEDILAKGESISFPDSVIELFRGDLGQNPGGFPEALSKLILKEKIPYTGRPNEHLAPIDFDKAFADFQVQFGSDYNFLDLLSYLFYPKVFEDYAKRRDQFGPMWHMPTPTFFYGLKNNEEALIELAPGKNILIRMLNVIDEGEGKKSIFFRLNGQTRSVEVLDRNFTSTKASHKKVSSENEIGSPLQGRLSKVLVKVGDKVEKNTPLFTIEAMKMESTVVASKAGKVSAILLNEAVFIAQDDVVVVLENF